MNAPDVVIIGGGLMGCAIALHLVLEDASIDVVVVEPDPTYEFAATTRASGGVRQLFTHPENIQLSQYTLELISRWSEFVSVAGTEPPDLGWRQQGYLFIAGAQNNEHLRSNLTTQLEHGVRAEWYDPDQVAARWPSLTTRDLSGGVFSPDDGWLDPYAMLQGTRRKCEAMGVRFVRDRIVDLDVVGVRVDQARLQSGDRLRGEVVINAAGTWAPDIAAQVGMRMPIEPMRRFEHFVETDADLGGLPFVKDTAGLAVRPEGDGLSVGLVDFDHPSGADFSIDHGYFNRAVWPALAHRIPALDQLRVRSTTVGLYDQNRFDGNPIIDNYAGHLDNFYVACGFSGHGLMHAMGVGRALAERIVHGHYVTLDLARMGYARVLSGERLVETGVR
jgi:glycine/D-amino acid oxidase-like deaminating enzyme